MSFTWKTGKGGKGIINVHPPSSPNVKPLREEEEEEEEEEEDSLAAPHSNRGKEEEGGRRQHYGAHGTVPLLTTVGIAALPPSPKSKWCF